LARRPPGVPIHDAPVGREATHTRGTSGLVEQHQRVERVAVPADRLRHVAVVGREGDGAEQPAVEAHDAALLVVRELVAAAARGSRR